LTRANGSKEINMINKKFSVVLILAMLLVAATLVAGPMGYRFTQSPVAATVVEDTEATTVPYAGYGRGYGAALAATTTDTTAFAARQAQMLQMRSSVTGTNLTEECLVTGEAPVLGGRVMQNQMTGNLSARGNKTSQQPMGRGGVANQLPAVRGNMVNQLPAARGAGQGRSR
jgi:hypothetical protein